MSISNALNSSDWFLQFRDSKDSGSFCALFFLAPLRLRSFPKRFVRLVRGRKHVMQNVTLSLCDLGCH
jgi:hypothetical protein